MDFNNATRITSLENFVENIIALSEKLQVDYIKNEVLFYRGQNNKEYYLEPGLTRYKFADSPMTMIEYERNLIEETQRRLPSVFSSNLSPLNRLALLQHYGIPTRLLDITKNPLIALYFACEGELDKDGELFVFKDNQYDLTSYPIFDAISDTYRFVRDDYFEELDSFLDDVMRQPYFIEQIDTLTRNNLKGDYIDNVCKHPLFVRGQNISQRQTVQQSYFILFPNDIGDNQGKKCFYKNISPMNKSDDSIIERYVIPKESKLILLDQLRLFGITKGSIFPDNIDFICSDITSDQKKRLN